MVTEVGILEPVTHPSYLFYMSEILNAPERNVTIFAHETVFSAAEPMFDDLGDYRVRLFEEDEDLSSYLEMVEAVCDERLDFLFVNSIYGNPEQLRAYSEFDPDCPSFFWVHNLNIWLGDNYRESLAENDECRLDQLLRQKILSHVDSTLIEYEPLLEQIGESSRLPDPRYFFPTFYDPELAPTGETDDAARFVVPGRITAERKDYYSVVDAFETVYDRTEECELVFLGHANDDSGAEILSYVAERGLEDAVVHFEEWIPQEVFDETLATCTALVSPVVREFENRYVTEIYGRTKGTGNVHDAVRFGKPILLPGHFPLGDDLDGIAHNYDGVESLASLMETLAAAESGGDPLLEQARASARKFDLASQRQRFSRIVDDLTS